MVDNKKYTKYTYDLCIIGGGINGAAVAAKASSLGLKVFLCEKNDFASGTSSSSTKLIHGGLRYLEHYNFKLVRLALKERIVLQQLAPHIIWPIEFILVCNSSIRNNWLIRIGLFLYDFLAPVPQHPGL
jgi:glycerol-3-phosphate dehydrogenase